MARRAGGRKARVELRNAPLAEDIKPVNPGETGGQYKPLSDTDVAAIHENIFRILEEIGFAQATEHCIEKCVAVGAILGDDGRLRMPRHVVENALKIAGRNITLYGQTPEHDLDLSGQRVHYATAGAAVMIADPEKNEYRESEAQDLYDMARIADTCEHIHFFQRMCVLRDISDNYAMDLNTVYCSAMGTSKHIGASWTEGWHLEKTLEMLHMMAGGEDKWRERPFVSQSNCYVVPPMKFTEEALDCLRIAVEGGMPVLLLSAGQAGATAPARLPGAVSQAWAECLGGLVYVNAIKEGAPAIIGTWPFVSDLRTGAMSGGSPEQGLLSAACMQVGQAFDLPSSTACGMSDSKFPDLQAGAERSSNALVAGLAGANIVYEAAGMYASLLSACPESLIIDNDILGSAMRVIKGMEVNEDSLGFEVIKDVCMNGPGHYLGTDQTMSVMQSEYLYPDYSDRFSPNEWEENGKPVLLDKAIKRKNEILKDHFPSHISAELDAAIREKFPIFLPREAVSKENV